MYHASHGEGLEKSGGGGGGEGVTQGGAGTPLCLAGGAKAPVAAVVPGSESALGSQRQCCQAKEWAPA